jgi:hypothetical protein
LLSSFAFNFNLRHYHKEVVRYMFSLDVKSITLLDGKLEIKDFSVGVSAKVGRSSWTVLKAVLKPC